MKPGAVVQFQLAMYKGTRPGVAGIYNRLVRWWTGSIYSHCELVFAEGWCGSSSFDDGGVRLKLIDLSPAKWDLIELPVALEQAAYAWFVQHRGEKYDLMGNLHFIVRPVMGGESRWFCSEAIAAALGIPDPWRYDPGMLASTLRNLNKPASAGFFIGRP